MIVNIAKGAKDILPSEVYKWHYLEEKWKTLCERYGFCEMRTPVFEHTELFKRGIGDSSDVVRKEMYSFEIAGRNLSLKPEGTSPIVRSFIENKLYAEQLPAKYYYNTACYRYEKMQKGRQREFHQFGIEIFGADSMLADAEVISLASEFFAELGIDDLKLHINSIGCPECRREYRKALQNFLRPVLDKLCGSCRERFEKNPMRILDCKSPECRSHIHGAPVMLDYLCDSCKKAFGELKADLEALDISYEVDPGIVRGLDYYTKTAFEFVSGDLGAQSTVCGGGRYDSLVEEMGGPATAGVGFGLGVERLLLILEAKGINIPEPAGCELFVASVGEEAQRAALRLINKLRKAGVRAVCDVCGRSLKAQFKYADRLKAGYTVVIGEDELSRGVLNLRDMKNSSQEEIAAEDILERIRK